jgi:Spy/CpxP family protein refolding chaperone
MRWTCHVLAVLLVSISAVRAQPQPQPQPPPDPFAGNLFPPDLIMQHQQALGLSEEQKDFLKSEVRKLQTRLTELQWDLQDAMEMLTALVQQDQVDAAQALAQLDKVLAVEGEIKRMHIGLLIGIKNNLTPQQRARLREIVSGAKGK